jgi:hypothetical protein
VDLLRAVGTDLAVSSAYHDEHIQAARLVDGDLETAWSSRTGDLAGAWIDVRLPEDVTVTSIEMTAGFTKSAPGSDLFTSNHRVARVRVLRDGEEVALHELDIESRELQTVPAEGSGGVYRIELVTMTPGEREDWREACVSELRVMGRAESATPNERYPRFGVGELPEPRPAEGSADREALRALAHRRVAWFADRWIEYGDGRFAYDSDAEVSEVDPDEGRALFGQRREALVKVLELVEAVDHARADQLRMAMNGEGEGLDAAVAAFDAVEEFLGDEEERCWWAKNHARIRLANLVRIVSRDRELTAEASDDSARVDRLSELGSTLQDVYATWNRNGRGNSARLEHLGRPPLTTAGEREWDGLDAALAVARPACGWDE